MICFYHNGDLDGKCAGALVKRKYPECRLYGTEYGDVFPWEAVDEKVFMVDFSLSPEEMVRLNDKTELIWIDHYLSTVLRVEAAVKPKEIAGLRDERSAACKLVWKYFHPIISVPLVVSHLSLYDIWRHSDPLTLPFQYGARLMSLNPENQELWSELFAISDEKDRLFQYTVEVGKNILLYEVKTSALLCDNSSFEVEFEGRKSLVLNSLVGGSKLFDLVPNRASYDLFIAFGFRKGGWRVSLYSEKEDVSLIAAKYGGGGHKGAAGFVSSVFPFSLKREHSFV